MTIPRRGIVTLVFDDGYESIFNTVVPVLDKYSLPGVFAVSLDGEKISATEKRPVTSWTEWLSIKNRGHEIASHAVTHANLTKLSTSELTEELKESRDKLSADTIVYPGGAYNDQVLAEAKKHYQAGRTVKRGFENVVPADPMQLKTFNFSRRNFSLLKVNLLAIWAWLTNSWLIETYHLVDDNDSNVMHNVPLKDFASHVRLLSRLPIHVRTIKDVINKA